MSQTLSRWQAVMLGLVVVLALALGGTGLARIAGKQGLWSDHVEVTVGFAEPHDVGPGTLVRIRGVDAGQVVAVEYPENDAPGAAVTLRMRLDAKYADRLYADATAQIHSTGLLGSRVISIQPGTPSRGPLADGKLTPTEAPDLAKAAAQLSEATKKIGGAADETAALVKEVRTGKGTLAKLVNDDELYGEIKGLAKDSRAMVKRADAALGVVEGEAAKVDTFVADGRETLRSVRQGTDAMQRLPLVRNYVEDPVAILVRPTHRREAREYSTGDLFEAGTAILTESGRQHITAVAEWLKTVTNDDAEVVVAAMCDPADRNQTVASAAELTKKQCEVVVEFLKEQKAHKIGLIARRKMTPIGLGFGPSPVVEPRSHPAPYLQVLLFTPN